MNSPLRVLYVDDDPDMRRWVEAVLTLDSSCTLCLCASGREALTVDFAPDVIMLDVRLPDTDGPTLCAALRARSLSAPVVYVTASRDPAHIQRLAAEDAADVVVKPLVADGFVDRLRQIVAQA